MFQMLIDGAERTLKHSIEVEESIAIDQVTNFNEVWNIIIVLIILLIKAYIGLNKFLSVKVAV